MDRTELAGGGTDGQMDRTKLAGGGTDEQDRAGRWLD